MNKPASMPATRFGGVIKLALLFSLQVGFILVFHSLGSIEKLSIDFSHFSEWLDTTPPEIALVASIRILALAFSYWMLGTSLLYMVARSFRIPGLLRAMEITTLPGVRRVIDAGLAAAIVGGTVFGGAAAVFAKSTDASKLAVPAPAARVLYNPTPSGDPTGPSTNLVNPDAQPSDSVPIVSSSDTQNVSSTKKVVIGSPSQSATPTPGDVQPVQQDTTTTTPGEPRRDTDGFYIPTPVGDNKAPESDGGNEPTPSESTTTSPRKVVVPTDAETTTTTTPKVTVPSTTAPITSDDNVQVGGKQVVRPNDTPSDAPIETGDGSETAYTVVSGDNFWKIAKNQVRNGLGREPSNAEVANYWVKLIDANRATIRSGDPDLIFPGEVFQLPPL